VTSGSKAAGAGVTVVTATGACLLAVGQGQIGALMVIIGLGSSIISVSYIVSGRRMWQAAANDYSGEREMISRFPLPTTQLKGNMTDTSFHRWVGAGTMPGNLGYMQATLPLAVLELAGPALIFRLRPRFLAKLTGIQALVIRPGDDVAITPVKSKATWQGIEINVPGTPAYTFWTTSRAEILSSLENVGFTVSPPQAD
jgi:hypothetical protein